MGLVLETRFLSPKRNSDNMAIWAVPLSLTRNRAAFLHRRRKPCSANAQIKPQEKTLVCSPFLSVRLPRCLLSAAMWSAVSPVSALTAKNGRITTTAAGHRFRRKINSSLSGAFSFLRSVVFPTTPTKRSPGNTEDRDYLFFFFKRLRWRLAACPRR